MVKIIFFNKIYFKN